MNKVTIDKKEYVLVAAREYEKLLECAATKTKPARKLSLAEGKKLAYKLIDRINSTK